MPIHVKCPTCGKGLHAPDALLGKLAKCPACGAMVTVTSEPGILDAGSIEPMPHAAPSAHPAAFDFSGQAPAGAPAYTDEGVSTTASLSQPFQCVVVKRIDVFTIAKMMGALYALLGLIGGLFMFVMFSLTAIAAPGRNSFPVGIVAGIGILFFVPFFYGIAGFIGGAITGLLYNLLASYIGGIEFEFAPRATGPYGARPYAR